MVMPLLSFCPWSTSAGLDCASANASIIDGLHHLFCACSHACPPLCFTCCTLPASPCTYHACPHPFLSFFRFIFMSTTQQPTCFCPLCLAAFLCTHPPVPVPSCSCLCSFCACSHTCLPLCFHPLHLACFPLHPLHLCSPLPMVSFSFFFLYVYSHIFNQATYLYRNIS